MVTKKDKVTSGIRTLDSLLGGGIIIGDNVIWYDDAGSLAAAFCLNLIKASKTQKKYLIYISFDRSPKNLLEKLEDLAANRFLTILDCFTHGKGEGSDVFLEFYKDNRLNTPCQIIKVDNPKSADHVMGAFYGLQKTMKEDVRFVFDSLTGMQELWGDEEKILKFYSHSCPRLYELNTIAYWVVEKRAHTEKLIAHLNKITQVAIDLSLKRGKTTLSVIKAENHDIDTLNKPSEYWAKGMKVTFSSNQAANRSVNLGSRIKELRTKNGLSQTDLAKCIGVTPSTISQVESNQIFPSLPALIKMAEILSVELGSFFISSEYDNKKVVFLESKAVPCSLPNIPGDSVLSKLLTPVGLNSKVEPYLIDIPPQTKLPAHFFIHKGEEMGFLLAGELELKIGTRVHKAGVHDLIYLMSDFPSRWENPGQSTARLLWLKIK
jgi:transcriptional regulator with XRE-family HTH domain/KaiC/GvpD/RAD55 family RecA-like ATPase